jgi:hypothetical protein
MPRYRTQRPKPSTDGWGPVRRGLALCLCALACGPATADNRVWVERATVRQTNGNLYFPVQCGPDRSAWVDLVATGTPARTIRIHIADGTCRAECLPRDALASPASGIIQTGAVALPAEGLVEFTLKLRDGSLTLYCGDAPVFAAPHLLDPPLIVKQPEHNQPPNGNDDVFFQRTAPFVFADDFLVPQEESNALSAWCIESGAWNLHSVIDDAAERDLLKRGRSKPIAARSPNFYSLQGQGTNAVITAGYPFYDNYCFEAALRAAPGEMGLLFYRRENGGCHGFTLVKTPDDPFNAELHLWRAATSNLTQRTLLARARTGIVDGQWAKLRVRTFLDRIEAEVDQTRIFDLPLALPDGGGFGLLTTAAAPVRFDDVSARSHGARSLNSIADLQRQTLYATGRLLPRRPAITQIGAASAPVTLRAPSAANAQTLVLGAPADAPHVFAATFAAHGAAGGVGLVLAYRNADAEHLRFVRHWDEQTERFRLERVSTNGVAVLESFALPRSPLDPQTTFRLMCDVGDGREIRCYRDRVLVLVHRPTARPSGASGIHVAPRTAVKISALSHTAQRNDVYRNAYEKNRQFITDPYMRHWSSPEGQWIAMPDQSTWYKGDLFGRFAIRLPFVPGSAVHLGVGETGAHGFITVTAANHKLELRMASTNGTLAPLASIPQGELKTVQTTSTGNSVTGAWYTLDYEDHWFRVLSGTQVLARAALPSPMTGTRVRLSGFTTEQLTHSDVARYQVKDYLFTQSLHDWTINGGRWEVINRFNCLLEWSHMNGESADGLAALWSKYQFGGDFCFELYAGIRHGWYNRAGDMNLTVMNRRETPGDGYTVTCAGWDADLSQRFTRLFRNGQQIAESDAYTVPRVREGSKRQGYNPLVKAGRDIHGAWYYIKLRRIGRRLQFFFDNEPILEAEDDGRLDSGSFGIWTFMNSLMVARVKMAADVIAPRPLAFTALPLITDQPGAPPVCAPSTSPAITNAATRAPLAVMTPDYWFADDPVGQLNLTWHADPDGVFFAARGTLGSGTMVTRCRLPTVPLLHLAGWQFAMRQSPRARLNFHYSIGTLDAAGRYKPLARRFHHLSGTQFTAGPTRLAGATAIAPTPASALTEPGRDWTPVVVWIDPRGIAAPPERLHVRIEGFGNLQPSAILQGLAGNDPGAGYAVKAFTPITRGAPTLTADVAVAGRSFDLLNPESGRLLGTQSGLAAVNDWLTTGGQQPDRPWQTVQLCPHRDGRRGSPATDRLTLTWVTPAAIPALRALWSVVEPDTIELQPATPEIDPRLLTCALTWNGVPAPRFDTDDGRWIVPAPPTACDGAADNGRVTLAATFGSNTWTTVLSMSDRAVNHGPVLVSLGQHLPLAEGFEAMDVPRGFSAAAGMLRIRGAGGPHGRFLSIRNNGAPARLRTRIQLAARTSLASMPLAQFRYRAGDMTRISLLLNGQTPVALNEPDVAGRRIRGSGELIRDGQWHTWQGMLSDAATALPFGPNALSLQFLQLGSAHRQDQTGRYSELDLDNLLLGPAVSAAAPLVITPRFADLDGVAHIAWAVCSGVAAYDDLSAEQRAQLEWSMGTNGVTIHPSVDALPDGQARLHVRATDRLGHTSAVTSLPFLLDREPPVVKYAFEATQDPACNGNILHVRARNAGLAPLDTAQLSLMWNGKPCPLNAFGSSHTHTPQSDSIKLNWAFLGRRWLNRTQDGATNTIAIAGLVDGAQNRAPNLSIPVVTDYARDKTPPTLVSVRYPTNVCWALSASKPQNLSHGLAPMRQTGLQVTYDDDGSPYVVMQVRRQGGFTHSFPSPSFWNVAQYPWLGLCLRRTGSAAEATIEFDIVVEIKGLGRRAISLTDRKRGKGRLVLPTAVAWSTNAWQEVILNISDLLRQELPRANLAAHPIKSLGISLGKIKNNGSLAIREMIVFSAWNDQHRVTVDAFDASGLASTPTQELLGDGRIVLAPMAFAERATAGTWTLMTVADKAGNRSYPLRIPFIPPPPATEPAPASPTPPATNTAPVAAKPTSGNKEQPHD